MADNSLGMHVCRGTGKCEPFSDQRPRRRRQKQILFYRYIIFDAQQHQSPLVTKKTTLKMNETEKKEDKVEMSCHDKSCDDGPEFFILLTRRGEIKKAHCFPGDRRKTRGEKGQSKLQEKRVEFNQ